MLATTYSALRPAVSRATGWLSHDARRFLYQSARWTARTMTGRGRAQPPSHDTPAFITAALRAACEFDPAISWTANSFADLPIWTARDDGYTEIIETALNGIAPGGAIVAVPWVGVGGADLVSVNYARALDASTAFRGRTTILGTFLPSRTRADMLPEGIPYLHLDERWLAFPAHVRRRLIAQIVVMARPSLLVSVNSFHVTEALRSHSAQMLDGTRIYSTLFAFDRIGDGFPVNPITDDSQRDYLDDIDGLITDNTTTARLIAEILALPPEQVLVHRQPVGVSSSSSTAAWADGSFSPESPFRLVWPHRLDEEKRPDALVAIAEELRRRGAPAQIEVWGQRVLSADGDTLLRRFRDAGISYRGPYSGGLAALDTDGYHGLLLTSKSEGLPLILVQALQAGLPVVASGVGGVPDIILDGETGLLTSGPDDASGFADAIQTLMDDLELRRRLIRQGAEFAAANHSWERFAEIVDHAFGS